jgi:hypothetical protein
LRAPDGWRDGGWDGRLADWLRRWRRFGAGLHKAKFCTQALQLFVLALMKTGSHGFGLGGLSRGTEEGDKQPQKLNRGPAFAALVASEGGLRPE